LIAQAKEQRADVVHFSETCLAGYAGVEFKSWDGYDWSALKAADTDLLQVAKKMRIGLVYGTNHHAWKRRFFTI
jgi:deaminated glutathione amidase